MTLVSAGNGPPNDKTKAVSFRESGGGPNQREQDAMDRVKGMIPDLPESRLLPIIRNLINRGKDPVLDGFCEEVLDKYYQEGEAEPRSVTPLPKQGCAERPTQTSIADDHMEGPKDFTKPADREDMDIKKAIEESLMSSYKGPSKATYKKSMPENPQDMIRPEKTFTGLHNVGNSCWFNVLGQILYSLPEFRRILFDTVPPEWLQEEAWDGNRENVTGRHLLLALRRLFAHMQHTQWKYIDPTEAMNVMYALDSKANNGQEIMGIQQDSTEMLLKVMEWLELALVDTTRQEHDELHVDVEGEDAAPADVTMSESDTSVTAVPAVSAPGPEAMEISPAISLRGDSVCQQDEEEQIAHSSENTSLPVAPTEIHFAVPHVPQPKMVATSSTSTTTIIMEGEEGGDGGGAAEVNNVAVGGGDAPNLPPNPNLPLPPTNTTEAVNAFARLFQGRGMEKRGIDNIRQFTSPLQMWNLNVSYENLHDSLEATQYGSDSVHDGGDHGEVWYDHLPAVIVFTAGRFIYQNGRTQKLHNRFKVPETVFMDRYLHVNEEPVKEIRRGRMENRKRLAAVRSQLKGMEEYPLDGKTANLLEILRSTISFIGGAGNNDGQSPSSSFLVDSTMESVSSPPHPLHDPSIASASAGCGDAPPAPNLLPQFPFPLPGPVPFGPSNRNDVGSHAPTKEVAPTNYFVESLPKVLPKCESVYAPDQLVQISEAVQTIENELTQKVEALRNEEALLDGVIENAYNVDGLLNEEYALHGLIIHEGDANVGHYWAYVKDPWRPESWQKLNDKAVDSCDWSQVEKDYIGGVENTSSGYCFVYVKKSDNWVFEYDRLAQLVDPSAFWQANPDNVNGDEGAAAAALQRLPQDLRQFVEKNNEELGEMIRKHQERLDPNGPRALSLSDPEHSRTLLSKDVYPQFTTEQRAEVRNKVEMLREFISENSKTYDFPKMKIAQANVFYQSIVHHVVYAIEKQINEDVPDAEKGRLIYEKCLTEWFEQFDSVQPRGRNMDDARFSAIEFWRAMGHKMPSTVHQLIIANSLRHGTATQATQRVAEADLRAFEELSPDLSDDHSIIFSEITLTYQLLGFFWAILKECITKVFVSPMFPREPNNVECHCRAVDNCLATLKWSTVMWSMYEHLVSGHPQANLDKAVVDLYLIRTILMAQAVVVSARLCIYAGQALFRQAHTQIITEHFFPVLARISEFARTGDKTAQFVIEQIRGQWALFEGRTYKEIGADKERQELHGKILHFTSPEASFQFVQLPKSKLHVDIVSLSSDIEDVEKKRLAFGMSTEGEAAAVLERLSTEACDMICSYLF